MKVEGKIVDGEYAKIQYTVPSNQKKKKKRQFYSTIPSILFFHIRVETGKSSPKKIVLVLIVLY